LQAHFAGISGIEWTIACSTIDEPLRFPRALQQNHRSERLNAIAWLQSNIQSHRAFFRAGRIAASAKKIRLIV
jgi:hypothetical protein